MIPASFDYCAPASMDEVMRAIEEHSDDFRVLAGGQSLIPMMKLRLSNPGFLIDLRLVSELDSIAYDNGVLVLGAMTSYRSIETSPIVAQHSPILRDIASKVADVQVRNRGTIGGAIAHADPAGDMSAGLIAAKGVVTVQGPSGRRNLSADEFFVDAYTTELSDDEILVEFRFPAVGTTSGQAYEKIANRASHFAVVGVAAVVELGASGSVKQIDLGITGAGYKPTRAHKSEKALLGMDPSDEAIHAASKLATDGIECIEDMHGSSEYRANLVEVLARRAITKAVERAKGG